MYAQRMIISSSRTKGITMVLIGAVLWGISGTVAQYLFQYYGFSPEWLVVVRLLVSGTILLGLASLKGNQKIWDIWKDKKDVPSLILFSIFGMLAVQYTFFAAIKYSNAATATVLQYLAPAMISCFIAIRAKRLPTIKECIAVVLALLGTFLLVTKGSMSSLSISGIALFWGLTSAVALAYYTLQPLRLLAKWGSALVIGWGMMIGGLSFSLFHPPWKFVGQWSFNAFLAVIFIIVFGTLIAFYCYLESLKYISASETSILASVEPLSAAFLSVVWLHVSFGHEEWLGTLCIISTIIILSFVKNKEGSKANTLSA
ncbi:EamA family transporter [Cytobacillus praedii]|uniref:EamA family transporter n=1 Tax=Cytobacillus praedii TaxID=1742358 RepID=A0A4R1B2W4_9BACI|nr:EamA family transporter [Cytobacillus praedii]MED3551315.1 EamA family transporter [Cytobacillus praedii]TCJ05671.1 EamA family transporter [Cytobacillus praedii]